MCMHVHTFAMQTDAKHANYNYNSTVSCSCISNSSCSDNFKFKNRICRNKKPGRTAGAGGAAAARLFSTGKLNTGDRGGRRTRHG